MNADHERQLLLRQHAESWRAESRIDAETERIVTAQVEVPWRRYGVVVQCVFFVLTAIGMLACYGLLAVLDVPGKGIVVGIGAIASAELLIRVGRWDGTGVESALWIGGLFSMITELPSSGKPEAMLVLAAAAAIPGGRLRNPVFGTLAAILVMVYAERRFDLGVMAALAMAAVAALALLRTWRRPSTEWLWILLVLAMPVAGRFTADPEWRVVTIALYAGFGAFVLLLAIAKRHHALYFAAAIALGIAIADVGERIDVPIEAKLAIAGAALLALATLVGRALRGRTSGLVATPARLTQADEALEIAAALAAAHATRAEPGAETRPEGDGGFGGAGATGDY